MIIRLIHGINSKEGNNNMSTFQKPLQELLPNDSIELFEYGFVSFLKARWVNNDIAYDLASLSKLDTREDKEVWVTHSNGAAIGYLAVRDYGAQPDMIINFNPALDRWRTAAVPRVEVVHSAQDRVVELAQWTPFNVWGDQGKVGYRGKLKNTTNHYATEFPPHMAYKYHCGAFEESRRTYWAAFVKDKIEEIR